MPLRVGVRQRQVLRIRGIGFADQTDAIAGQRREWRRVDHQPHLPLAGEAGSRRAVQEPRGHRQGIGRAGDDRAAGGAEVHRHPIRHEGIDAELRPPDRRPIGIGLHLDGPGAGRRAGRQRHRQMHRGFRQPRRRCVQEHLPVRPLHDDMHGNIGGPPGIVAQQRHHLRRLAWPVDAAIQPDIGVERTRMRQSRHAAIRQIERGAAEVEHRVVLATQHLERARRHRAVAMQQRRGEAADAVGIGGGLAEDLVVLRQQAQRDARRAAARRNSRAPERSAHRCRARRWARSRCAGSSARRSAHSACRRRHGRSAHRGRGRTRPARRASAARCARCGWAAISECRRCLARRCARSARRSGRRPRIRPAGQAGRCARTPTTLRSVRRARVSLTLERLTVLRPIAGV